MERFGARDATPLAECERLIKEESDYFVGIYAYRYGFMPAGQRYSITQLEYMAATEAGLPRLIYIVAEDVPWLPAMIDVGEPAEKLQAFKSQLKTNHICYMFRDEEDLAAQVASDLERRFSLAELERVEPGRPDPGVNLGADQLASIDDWNKARSGIYQENREVFLAHVIEPSRRPGQRFDISIFLVEHEPGRLDQVQQAEFFMGRWWGNRIIKVENRGALIGFSTAAYGAFLCTCRVTFRDGYQCLLSRYIDFEMEQILKG
jgi:hypothetical protein